MALTLPQLDDRGFNDLTAELRSLIPRYARTWTNHNPADPGMTLVELLAWLAEMVIYRLNRIEDRTYRTFLELLGVQPSAPRTTVTFELRVPEGSLAEGFVIPRGTRTAARDEDTGEEILFETLTAVPLDQGRWDEDRSVWVFQAPAMNTIEVEDECLGFGTGKPYQELAFKQQPVFLDRTDKVYAGNPRITVEVGGTGDDWSYSSDLLDHVDSLDPDPARRPILNRRFAVEHLSGLVRFGDGPYGAIPPEGAKIFSTYRKLGGTRGNVKANSITQLKDPIPGIADAKLVTVFNEYPAEGGVDEETFDDLLTRGLGLMTERSRAVSQEDFEALAQQAAPGRVARANVVFDRNLEGDPSVEADAHVSVIVLPAASYLWPEEQSTEGAPDADAVTLRHSCADLAAAMAASKTRNLHLDILAFLDQRRLVTTVVHVVGPSFTPVSITMTVQAKQGVNGTTIAENVRKRIGRFLDPYAGWLDGKGWPFGRKVYRSELYQQIEGIEGVDYVETLLINGDAAGSAVDVGEFSLLCVSDLSVTVR
ncbi:MAG TPA: putative baseplate assembly protein [Syntrophobacteria bacterium]|nr:putative baseplate assembly protein [Syntrophobacteria bacterium]